MTDPINQRIVVPALVMPDAQELERIWKRTDLIVNGPIDATLEALVGGLPMPCRYQDPVTFAMCERDEGHDGTHLALWP